MVEVIAERIKRYVLDGSDEDLRRLLAISQVTAERVGFIAVLSRPGTPKADRVARHSELRSQGS
jgi:hypothetical protein